MWSLFPQFFLKLICLTDTENTACTNTSEFSKGISCQLGVVLDHLKVHHKPLLSLAFVHYMQTQESKEIFLLSGQIHHGVCSSQHLLLE